MIRQILVAANCTVVLSALMLPSSRADDFADPFAAELQSPPVTLPAPDDFLREAGAPPALHSPAPLAPRSIAFRVSDVSAQQTPQPIDDGAGMMAPQMPVQQPGYVQLGAPMYPTPRPNIPIWSGSTMITNQAFAPHEMLYPHTYRAMYPPYYHRVKGGWILTPFGVRSHEKWELQGTQVEVKYRSQYPGLLQGKWYPPSIK